MTAIETRERTATRLRLVLYRLSRSLRQRNPIELTPSQLSALAVIEEFGPLRVSALAERESVGAPVATRVAASLEDLGLLVRESDPADRRASLIGLSSAGQSFIDQLWQRRTEGLAARLARLSEDDQRRIARALPALERLANEP